MLTRRELLAAVAAISASAQTGTLKALSKEDAADVEAIAAAIIPTDDMPGAREAGVIWFIDAALADYHRDQLPLYRAGLADLRARSGGPFAALSEERRVEVLRAIEKTEFFVAVRTHTVMGFLADPSYGGNRNHAGWEVIGFGHAHVYRPPFGAYDREG